MPLRSIRLPLLYEYRISETVYDRQKIIIFFAMHPKLSGKEQTQNVSVKQ